MATTNAGAIGVTVEANNVQFDSSMDKSAAIAERSMARVTRAQQSAAKDADRFVSSIQRQVDSFGLSGTALLRYEAQLKGVSAQAEPLIARLERMKDAQAAFASDASKSGGAALAKGMDEAAASADKATHATSGMTRELIVLGHEASQGNFTRFGGSLLVLAEYSQKAQAALSVLVGPVGLVVAGIGVLALAVIKGAHETEVFNNSLKLTGNFAGLTGDSFRAMAADIAKIQSAPLTGVTSALQEVVSTGRFSGVALEAVTKAALSYSKASGETAANVVKDMTRMADGVAKYAADRNREMHYLTAAELDYIKVLESQGKAEEAIVFNASKLDAATKQQTTNLGYLATAMKADIALASTLWEWMKKLGDAPSMTEQLAQEQAKLTNLREQEKSAKGNFFGDVFGVAGQAAAQQEIVDNLKARAQLEAVAAESRARQAKDTDQRILNESSSYESARTALVMASARQQVAITDLAREQMQIGIERSYEQGFLTLQGYIGAEYSLRKAALKDKLLLVEQEAKLENAHQPGSVPEQLQADAKRLEFAGRRLAIEKEMARLDEQRRNFDPSLMPGKLLDTHVSTPQQQFNAFEHAQAAQTEADYLRNIQAAEAWIQSLKQQEGESDKYVAKLNAETDSIGESTLARKTAIEVAKLQAIADKDLIGHESERVAVLEMLARQIDKVTAALQRGYDKDRTAAAGLGSFFAKYVEDATNEAKKAVGLTSVVVDGLENQMTAFLSGQKTDFHSLITAIIAEYERLYVVKPLLADIFGTTGTNGSASNGLGGILGSFAKVLGASKTRVPDGAGGIANAEGAYPASITGESGSGLLASVGGWLAGLAGYAQGTNYVPDNQLAFLHKGEAVIPASVNAAAGGSGRSSQTVHIHVSPPQGMDRGTAQQHGRDIGIGIRQSLARND